MKLVRFDQISEPLYIDFINEWEDSGERLVPSAISRNGKTFNELVDKWSVDETDEMYKLGFVPSTLYFLLDKNKIVGAIHLRHELNDRLLLNGGHIGYGVRPSERRKGYAKHMLNLLLDDLRNKGYKKVLITCDDTNIASAKTIEYSGGILKDKPMFEGVKTRRYWVYL